MSSEATSLAQARKRVRNCLYRNQKQVCAFYKRWLFQSTSNRPSDCCDLRSATVTPTLLVGHGSKWANPFKKGDVAALRGEPDVEAAYQDGGWKEAAKMLYVEHIREQGLDVRELRGRDLVCTCRRGEPCHADVLLELANNDNPPSTIG